MRSALVWACVAGLALCAGGCASHKVKMVTKPGIVVAETPSRSAAPLVLSEIDVQARSDESSKYATQPASPGFTQFLAARLRKADVFTEVFEPDQAKGAPRGSARLRLTVQETVGYGGGAYGKAVLVGLTLFILEPVLWIECSGQCIMRAKLSLPDGRERTYEARTDGAVLFNYFYGFSKAARQTDAVIADLALQSIVSQMRNDPELAMAVTE